jgi:hypothetical protein
MKHHSFWDTFSRYLKLRLIVAATIILIVVVALLIKALYETL